MWNPPRGYKGLRTSYRHAIRVKIRTLPDGWSAMNRLHHQQMLMEEWCEDHCKHNWSSNHYSEWWFDKPQEAVMFKMIFGGSL